MAPRNKKKIKNPDGTWSKRPTRQQIVKRKQIQGGDGWTHVIGPHQHKIRESIDTNVDYVDRNLDEMSAQHEKMLRRWQESETRKTLATEILEFESRSGVEIKKIVCLGLGTLSNGNFTQQNNRHAQLAALMDVVDLLGGSKQLTMVAQDPVFGACDKAFLEFLGFRVVESPGAFEAIDGESLVYAVHCHEEIYEEIAKVERPAVMVGNDIEELCDSRNNTSELLKLLAVDYKETSIEPVLSKRRERADSFDQIFYSAFYATRLYLRISSPPHESIHNATPLLEEENTCIQIRGGTMSSGYDPILDERADEILELADNQNDSSGEGIELVAPRKPKPPFEIWEDPPQSPPKDDETPEETPSAEANEDDPEAGEDTNAHGDPGVEEHLDPEPVQSEVEENQEDGEYSEPGGYSGSEESPEVEEDEPDYRDASDETEYLEWLEDKENYPPPNGNFDKESVGEDTRQITQDFVNKRASIHNWAPGLHLNDLPTFNPGQEGLGFIFAQRFIAQSPPLS